jgi:nicotinate-nucleotide adenylyltransferase
MTRRRRALFGGSFDPVHFGHLLVAEALRELERLDEVVFVPAARSPHKRATAATGEARLAMLRLAVRDNPCFRVSDFELRRRGPSYTIETVRAFAARWGERPILVVGADALLELHTWYEADALLREARIVVYARPGAGAAAARAAALGLRYHAVVESPLQSRTLRARARRGRSLRYLVPEPVRRYILENKLYAPARRRA